MSARPRKRILYLINDLRRAGAETQLVRLVIGLDRSRFSPIVVLIKEQNDFADELAMADVPVVRLRRRHRFDVGVVRRLHREILQLRPALLHACLSYANLLAVAAARGAGFPPVVVSQRSSYENTLSPLRRALARTTQRLAAHVVVNSQAARNEEIAAGFAPDRISHIANGIEVPPQLATDRNDLGLPAGPLALCVAQLAPEKGHADLLAAWPRVRSAIPAALLALVGDGALRPSLESEARRLGVHDSVLFLGFRHPAAPYLAAADVVVLASRTEGMPNALLEAMALGKPVVATRVGGVPELVSDGESGVLAPPGDPAALAAALAGALASDRREAMGEAGRRRVRDHFSAARMIRETQAVYERVLGGASSA
jgi:glycosyltransferase involved in cell wall biosynthesis